MRLFIARSWVVTAVALALLSVVALSLTGCGSGGDAPKTDSGTTLGERPIQDVPTVCANCLSEEKIGQTVAVEGQIVQQCPASGCWFRVKDDVGEVFVDLAPAKLSLTEKREGQQVRVTGRVAKRGGQFRVEAQYVEFVPAKKDSSEK